MDDRRTPEELIKRLLDKHKESPSSDNQVLVKVAELIMGYTESIATIDEATFLSQEVVRRLADILEPFDANEANVLRSTLGHIPNVIFTEQLEELRLEYRKRMAISRETYMEMAHRLLNARNSKRV